MIFSSFSLISFLFIYLSSNSCIAMHLNTKCMITMSNALISIVSGEILVMPIVRC